VLYCAEPFIGVGFAGDGTVVAAHCRAGSRRRGMRARRWRTLAAAPPLWRCATARACHYRHAGSRATPLNGGGPTVAAYGVTNRASGFFGTWRQRELA